MSNASLHPSVDLELKKAFEDLQTKMFTSRNQMKVIGVQVDQLKRQVQHAKLTESELVQLDTSVRMYEGIGRMFVLSDKPAVLKSLEEKSKTCETKIQSLEKTKEYLEKSLKDSENSLRELITVKQGKK
ncbi:Prefoldin subunit 1 [Brachionus plicatilis]|uniref:Prefoldin subunit 1 n=1 Tax=Brachionus plicatilis TaxID=10195 RepID=A0A3M7RND9_BRAPC|nr:Prefoldin subunit 1 [Brachionus plicatilis]